MQLPLAVVACAVAFMYAVMQLSFATAANTLIAFGIGVAVEDVVAVAYACIAAFGWF